VPYIVLATQCVVVANWKVQWPESCGILRLALRIGEGKLTSYRLCTQIAVDDSKKWAFTDVQVTYGQL
jgi:hypothetical protein